ncbi:hypothetical protein Tco_1405324 [Tanacetum coccineum]
MATTLHFPDSCLTLGAVIPVVAWRPRTQCKRWHWYLPLGSWVVVVTGCWLVIVVAVVIVIVIAVVVVCSCRSAPTVLGQVAKLLAVSACWCTRTVMVEVTLGISQVRPSYGFCFSVPGSIWTAWCSAFCLVVGFVISRSFFKLPIVFACLSTKVLFLLSSIQLPSQIASCHALASLPQHLSKSGGNPHRHTFLFFMVSSGYILLLRMPLWMRLVCRLLYRCLVLLGSTFLPLSS